METVKFEKLDDAKFKSLTQEEMKSLDGGWGWHIEEIVDSVHPVYGEISEARFRRYTLFGRATDEWQVRRVD